MHDEPPTLMCNRRLIAIEKLKGYISGIPGASLMAGRDLERYQSRDYVEGWQIPVSFSDDFHYELHLLIDNDYPYTPPKVAIADGPEILAWPHLEADGFLCTLSPDTALSSEDPAEVAAVVLGEACSLIEESINQGNVDDFRAEFLSYWKLAANQGSPSFISLIEPLGPSRRVRVWNGQNTRVVGESSAALQQWLKRWGAEAGRSSEYQLQDGILIWLPSPLVPAEYPNNAADLWNLAHKESLGAAEILEELAVQPTKGIVAVLGADTVNGACFAAVTIQQPPRIGTPKRQGDPLIKGFRPGRIPRSVLVNRRLSITAKVTKANVDRADHFWIHGRDRDVRQTRMRKARVAILGCGSVGAPVARLLAQSGVGSLLLIDPGIMEWPNVGRHALGAGSVNSFKAPELAHEIEKGYPHLGEILWRREYVCSNAGDLARDIASYDLIVSTIGNWSAESYLNDVQQESGNYPPILYGWVEPHASAAHAVLIPPGDACLRCGTSNTGRPDLPVTSWHNGGDNLQAPECAALFTPYGPTELCWAHALIAETAINVLLDRALNAHHRVWIGPRSRIERAGGAWSAQWIAAMGDPGIGNVVVERTWAASDVCSVCVRRRSAA